MNPNFSLRDRKKMQTMVSLLDTFLVLLEHQSFHEIHVDEVCDRAGISKMTFFRYFSSKEEVLDYFVLRWCYRQTAEIRQNLYRGREGIRHVFQSASEIPNAVKILVALLQYYSKLKEPPAKKELTDYERYLISGSDPKFDREQVLSLRDIFAHYSVDEEDTHRNTLIDHLMTLFYGLPFQVYTGMVGQTSLSDAYRIHLDLLFAATSDKNG